MKSQEGDGLQSVVLLHTLPDDSSHLDWMLEFPRDSQRLITFRCPTGTDLFRAGGFQAERLDDHRRAYLVYEGAVSGGRGHVNRLARFELEVVEIAANLVRLMVFGEDGTKVLWTGRKKSTPNPEKAPGGVAWEFIGAVC